MPYLLGWLLGLLVVGYGGLSLAPLATRVGVVVGLCVTGNMSVQRFITGARDGGERCTTGVLSTALQVGKEDE